jgi:sulfur dioxygenase
MLQQFRSHNSTLSYIFSDGKKALIIDPVADEGIEKYKEYLKENNLELEYIIDTHTHADHISASLDLQKETGAKIIMHQNAPSDRKDIMVKHNDTVLLHKTSLQFLFTPGHTNDSLCIYINNMIFSGDTLLIGGCGRTDFQQGNSEDLYNSLYSILLKLPDTTIVYPGHDYKKNISSTIAQEKEGNPKLQMSKQEFIKDMNEHHPDLPLKFEESVQKNSQ